MDMEFECLKDKIEGATVNTAAAREHVGEIERTIQVIKERCCCVLHYLLGDDIDREAHELWGREGQDEVKIGDIHGKIPCAR